MKALKDAAAKALERGKGITGGRPPSEWCNRNSSANAESTDESHEVWIGGADWADSSRMMTLF